jgi:hypothetical protein
MGGKPFNYAGVSALKSRLIGYLPEPDTQTIDTANTLTRWEPQ